MLFHACWSCWIPFHPYQLYYRSQSQSQSQRKRAHARNRQMHLAAHETITLSFRYPVLSFQISTYDTRRTSAAGTKRGLNEWRVASMGATWKGRIGMGAEIKHTNDLHYASHEFPSVDTGRSKKVGLTSVSSTDSLIDLI